MLDCLSWNVVEKYEVIDFVIEEEEKKMCSMCFNGDEASSVVEAWTFARVNEEDRLRLLFSCLEVL